MLCLLLYPFYFAYLIFKNWIGEQLATFFSKLEIRYKCFGYFSIPSIFLELLSFHFTSNSLFDFCCVILRFPLICFLPQLRKLGCFVREPKAGWHYLAGVLWCSSPLEKQPRKVSFWDQKSSWFMAFDASCLLTKTHRFDIIQTFKKIMYDNYIFPSFSVLTF